MGELIRGESRGGRQVVSEGRLLRGGRRPQGVQGRLRPAVKDLLYLMKYILYCFLVISILILKRITSMRPQTGFGSLTAGLRGVQRARDELSR